VGLPGGPGAYAIASIALRIIAARKPPLPEKVAVLDEEMGILFKQKGHISPILTVQIFQVCRLVHLFSYRCVFFREVNGTHGMCSDGEVSAQLHFLASDDATA
jgi:hypothetical protein